jgi:hypothetical protein
MLLGAALKEFIASLSDAPREQRLLFAHFVAHTALKHAYAPLYVRPVQICDVVSTSLPRPRLLAFTRPLPQRRQRSPD